jgi:hypothetical protein
MTPESVHYGWATQIIAARQKILDNAFALHPERFVRNPPAHQEVPQQVWINPPKKKVDLTVAQRSAIVAHGDLKAAAIANIISNEVTQTKKAVH